MGTALVGMTASTANAASFTFGSLLEAYRYLIERCFFPAMAGAAVFAAFPEKLNVGVKSAVSAVTAIATIKLMEIKDKMEKKYIADEEKNKINNEIEEKGSKKTDKTKNYLVDKDSYSKYMFLP